MYYSQNTSLPARYNITTTFWKHHYEITGSHNLYVDNSQMTPGKPDLTFHTTNKEGPIIALSKYKHFSSDIEIGLSDGHNSNSNSNSNSIRWDTLHRDGWRSSKYKMTAEINGRLEKYTWRPTHKMSLTRGGSLDLVHDRTGAVAAVFASHCGFKGSDHVLTINACHGERFQLLVLMTCITLAEKTRRRNEAAAAGAASSASASAAAA
ncbi:C6 zinc finger domain protein [Penicillium waksmanii]|uniref:C6 zinc finger domain protein n=1 Tax=Penicillium waksmanii TaxID=69791 RepID=UPI002547299C|nr:C6 zinc finger domain protein [Penicillium waksmanii]KAJ5979871.1 C6 zinc finger domain protein [Penicillium waksmanii]